MQCRFLFHSSMMWLRTLIRLHITDTFWKLKVFVLLVMPTNLFHIVRRTKVSGTEEIKKWGCRHLQTKIVSDVCLFGLLGEVGHYFCPWLAQRAFYFTVVFVFGCAREMRTRQLRQSDTTNCNSQNFIVCISQTSSFSLTIIIEE